MSQLHYVCAHVTNTENEMVLMTVWSTPIPKIIHKNVHLFHRNFHTRLQSCIPFGTMRRAIQ